STYRLPLTAPPPPTSSPLSLHDALPISFGNLAAYGQTNLKRLLAYSTIAHAGFMMMGLATMTRDGAGAVLFYLVVYLFMNLGALDRKSTRLNSSHGSISYAVFCLKKKK